MYLTQLKKLTKKYKYTISLQYFQPVKYFLCSNTLAMYIRPSTVGVLCQWFRRSLDLLFNAGFIRYRNLLVNFLTVFCFVVLPVAPAYSEIVLDKNAPGVGV
ncbi:MAG: hypothetical protein MI673_04080, partial [Thiotrichales bacterium]|nr:hypothetical protein [Thiotrichales bacterium]